MNFFSPGRFLKPAALLLALLIPSLAPAAEPFTIHQPGIQLRTPAWNDIEIADESGKTLMTFRGFHVLWIPNAIMADGSMDPVTGKDGQKGVQVTYEETPLAGKTPIQVIGRFMVSPNRVDIQYDVLNVPESGATTIGGSMVLRDMPAGATKLPIAKPGLWERPPYGGVPYETADGKIMQYKIGDTVLGEAFSGTALPNEGWIYPESQHAPLTKVSAGHYTTSFSVILPPANWSIEAVAAQWHGRPLALHIGTDHLYNWWNDNSQPLSLDVSLVNTTQADRKVKLSHWVRNFAGEMVSQDSKEITVKPGEPYPEKISFTTTSTRDLFFAEVSATDEATGKEIFARTNLALLPPHEFKSTADDSIFGLSAYWTLPTMSDAQRLMQRMGVRWLRYGDSRDFKAAGIIANRHSDPPAANMKQEDTDAWIRSELKTCVEQGNPYWEVMNEINFGGGGIGMGDAGIGKATAVKDYVKLLSDIRRIQKETGTTQIKIMTAGLAGMDVVFMQKLNEAGGWPLFDAMALHPGRGNFTADYGVDKPYKGWTLGDHGSYWNFYGSVRTANDLLKQLGEKPLWLTEAYASGFPNSWWDDTPRNGAENTVLQFVLTKAEGAKCLMFYQLFDSVWYDQFGVNAKEREYFFGMISRDYSFKPALMAYCASAEALDQATFVRALQFNDSNVRGLLFNTPRGPMTVLWSRADGYVLTKPADHFQTPEPWIDTWKTKTPLSVAASGDSITAVNVIGQEQNIPATKGTAELELTGAPVIVYGLDVSKL